MQTSHAKHRWWRTIRLGVLIWAGTVFVAWCELCIDVTAFSPRIDDSVISPRDAVLMLIATVIVGASAGVAVEVYLRRLAEIASMSRKRAIPYVAIGVALLTGGCWFVYRVAMFGPVNVFSREHQFADERALTEEVAIEITKRTLEADGRNVAKMAPYREDRWPNREKGREHVFQRNANDPNSGYVRWGPSDTRVPTVTYIVEIEKHGSTFVCRAVRPE